MTFDKQGQVQTIRARIMNVLEQASRPMTGIEIARAASLTYKPTIDALQALMAYEKVIRVGSKFGSRWMSASKQTPDPTAALASAFDKLARGSNDE